MLEDDLGEDQVEGAILVPAQIGLVVHLESAAGLSVFSYARRRPSSPRCPGPRQSRSARQRSCEPYHPARNRARSSDGPAGRVGGMRHQAHDLRLTGSGRTCPVPGAELAIEVRQDRPHRVLVSDLLPPALLLAERGSRVIVTRSLGASSVANAGRSKSMATTIRTVAIAGVVPVGLELRPGSVGLRAAEQGDMFAPTTVATSPTPSAPGDLAVARCVRPPLQPPDLLMLGGEHSERGLRQRSHVSPAPLERRLAGSSPSSGCRPCVWSVPRALRCRPRADRSARAGSTR